jgi:hypothetical protein
MGRDDTRDSPLPVSSNTADPAEAGQEHNAKLSFQLTISTLRFCDEFGDDGDLATATSVPADELWTSVADVSILLQKLFQGGTFVSARAVPHKRTTVSLQRLWEVLQSKVSPS